MRYTFLALMVLEAFLCTGCDDGQRVDAAPQHAMPSVGESVLVPSGTLRKVEDFRRKVVFFQRARDYPCLEIPKAGEPFEDFFSQVMARSAAGGSCPGAGGTLHVAVVMARNGDLLYSTNEAIYRTVEGRGAELLVRLDDLSVTCDGEVADGLRCGAVLCASTTRDVVYVKLSNEPQLGDGTIYKPEEYAIYIGELDCGAERLRLLRVAYAEEVAIDADRREVYEPKGTCVRKRAFDSSEVRTWQLSELFAVSCRLSPDRPALLVDGVFQMGILDLKTGRETRLPINGKEPAWGKGGVIYFVQEEAIDANGVQDSSLWSFDLKTRKASRLFLVSCMRTGPRDVSLRKAPELSHDFSWLTWRVPVEGAERSTLLIDLENAEYRIVPGMWEGVRLY